MTVEAIEWHPLFKAIDRMKLEILLGMIVV